MDCSTLGFRVHHHLPEFAQVHVHWLSDAIYLILCLHLPLLPSIFPSIRVFSNEWTLHIRWPKHWSFSISPSTEYSGLISFRIDWCDFLAVQEALKSLLQHHNSKASILWCSALWSNSQTDVLISLNKMCADMWLTSWQCLLTNYVFIIIFSMFQKILTPDCFIFWKLTLQALFMMKSFIFYLKLHTRILEEKVCREKYNEIILIRVGNPSWFLFYF